MLAFQQQQQDASGQKSRQDGKSSRRSDGFQGQKKQGFKNFKSKQSPSSSDNVFQNPKSNDEFSSKVVSSSSFPSSSSSTSSTTELQPSELAADSLIGGFDFYESAFQRHYMDLRRLPKFLLYQSPSLKAAPIIRDEWDEQNQERLLQMERNTEDPSSLYEKFQSMRDIERKQMEERGLVDKEGTRKTLEDAISFRGSCLDMCPVYERIRRSIENDVRKFEKDSSQKISRELAVKAFSRPAAGQPPPLPSDVRPPQVLIQTLEYLIDNILGELPEAQSFLWDRTRSIRQDFTYQNFSGPEAVECHEKIVRIHILTLHIMAKSSFEYSQQQELEQMNKALKTLAEMYNEYRSRGISPPNESEFRAYYLLSQVRDPELDREIQMLPVEVIQDERVQLALNLRNLVQTNVIERGSQSIENSLNLYKTFFHLFKSGSIPILMSYLIEIHLSDIRFYALKSMNRATHARSKLQSIEHIKDLLAFDNEAKLEDFCAYYGISISSKGGERMIDISTLAYSSHVIPDKKPMAQPFSLLQDKRATDLKTIVNSGISNLNLVIPDSQPSPIYKKNMLSSVPIPAKKEATSSLFPISHSISNQNASEEELAKRKLLEDQRKKEVELKAQRMKEEEEQRRKLEEEESRMLEMKQRMLQRQEEKKKRKLELVQIIGSSLLKDLLDQVVKTDVRDVILPLVRAKLEVKEKKEFVLNSYSESLYESFISELVYFESLDYMANVFRERSLKNSLIKKVAGMARELKRRADLKKRKHDELIEASKSFGIPNVVKRKRATHDSIGYASHAEAVVAPAQPKPIDLSPLSFDTLLARLKASAYHHFEAFIFSEELRSTTSKFLLRKFSLGETLHHKFDRDGTVLDVIGTDKIDPKLFENICLLVFNCDGIERLKTQRLLLRELVDGISLNSNFKFEILVVYWEFEGIIQFSIDEIYQELQIPENKSIRNVEIVKLDPSLNCVKVQDALDRACKKLELSTRGEYNQRYQKPTKPLLGPTQRLQKFTVSSGSLELFDKKGTRPFFEGSSPIVNLPQKPVPKHLERYIEDSPRARVIPQLLSSPQPINSKKTFAGPSLKSSLLPQKPKSQPQSKVIVSGSTFIDEMFKPKKNKPKIDVYSTPRPKSSEMLQTPSFASNNSSISNLSNITFANHSVSTPIISKPNDKKKDPEVESEEDIPKSILELRKLAASVREKHRKK